jgi:hypothetical protein
MLARLGNVLYWAGCAFAILSVGLAVFMALSPGAYNPVSMVVFGAVIGVVLWLMGRACRYVLAGR